MSYQKIAAQLEFLAWRDGQLATISTQLEDALPSLLHDLALQVENESTFTLATSTARLRSSASKRILQWGRAEMQTALKRAESDLEETLASLPGDINLESGVWKDLSSTLPALAGAGLIAASVAAIPTVVSFATVSTSMFALWGTAAISWPLFTIGAVGIGVSALVGGTTVKVAKDKLRRNVSNRLQRETERQVFGLGEKPGARCLLSDIQAAVVQAGRQRILDAR